MGREKKLQLKKITIQDLEAVLDKDEQKMAKGGTDVVAMSFTIHPIFCIES